MAPPPCSKAKCFDFLSGKVSSLLHALTPDDPLGTVNLGSRRALSRERTGNAAHQDPRVELNVETVAFRASIVSDRFCRGKALLRVDDRKALRIVTAPKRDRLVLGAVDMRFDLGPG
jgi:hypothetical protein